MRDDVGLLNEQAFPVGYGEENDLCMRAIDAGWHHLVDPGVFVQHARSASFGSRREELAKVGAQQPESRHPTYPAAGGAMPQLPEVVLARSRIARRFRAQIGRASCRERVCQYVYVSVAAVVLQKKKTKEYYDAKRK